MCKLNYTQICINKYTDINILTISKFYKTFAKREYAKM